MASPSGKVDSIFLEQSAQRVALPWLIKAAARKIDNACAVTAILEWLVNILTVARGNS